MKKGPAARWTSCPGCGLELPANDWVAEPGCNASTECWELYGEVSGFATRDSRLQRHHQLAVDTYIAQHPGWPTSDRSIAFSLLGLHLALDRGASGTDVRALHQRLAASVAMWAHLQRPEDRGRVPVFDVALADPVDERVASLHRWAASVWAAWSAHHSTVAAWAHRHVGSG